MQRQHPIRCHVICDAYAPSNFVPSLQLATVLSCRQSVGPEKPPTSSALPMIALFVRASRRFIVRIPLGSHCRQPTAPARFVKVIDRLPSDSEPQMIAKRRKSKKLLRRPKIRLFRQACSIAAGRRKMFDCRSCEKSTFFGDGKKAVQFFLSRFAQKTVFSNRIRRRLCGIGKVRRLAAAAIRLV